MSDRYIKLYDKTLENPVVCKDGDHLAIWVYILLKATARPYDAMFGGKRITLEPGQFITGRRKIAAALGVSDSKVQRVLKLFQSEHQIEQRTASANRLITVLNWASYQKSEPRSEQQVNHDRTTSEPRVNTNYKEKKEKKERSIYGRFKNVRLTEEEYGKLGATVDQDIEKLSAYMASHGKTYKNHYATILNWREMDKKRNAPKPGGNFTPRDYTEEQLNSMYEEVQA